MQTKEMKRVTYIGLGMNVVLTATKAVLGVIMNSSSVIAEVLASGVVLLSRQLILYQI